MTGGVMDAPRLADARLTEGDTSEQLHREVVRVHSKVAAGAPEPNGQRRRVSRWEWIDRAVLVLTFLVVAGASDQVVEQNRAASEARIAAAQDAEDRQTELLHELGVVLDRIEDRSTESEISRNEFRRAVELLFEGLGVEPDEDLWQDEPTGTQEPQ